MPANVTYEYKDAEKKFHAAKGLDEKLKALKEMLSKAPTHKGAESLRADIKRRIARYKDLIQKDKKKRKGPRQGIKKEGAAQVVLLGKSNSGKSLLLKRLTGANVEIADYEFTTKKPEVGIMDYNGVKIQVVEIPAIVEDFVEKENGPRFMGIVREADLIVLLVRDDDVAFLKGELDKAGIRFNGLIIKNGVIDVKSENIEVLKKLIWDRLDLIYSYTKTPGKKKDFPPVALKKGANVEDLALVVHKDFVKRFKFARIWGKSAKFDGAHVGLKHKLEEGDTVEFHLK